MGKRRKARELAVQVLYFLEFRPGDPGEMFELISRNFYEQSGTQSFAKELVLGVCRERERLDKLIREASAHWRVERMAKVDRAILRIATFEILFMDDVPPKVSIYEAVELGKRFGSEDSGNFVNGVLDRIYSNLMPEDGSGGPEREAEV